MTPVTVIPYQRTAPMVGASGPERRAARQAGSGDDDIVGVTTRCLVEAPPQVTRTRWGGPVAVNNSAGRSLLGKARREVTR
jgi:hypothetical protein